MKQGILLHNPGAGDEDHIKSDLVKSIEKAGFGCVYFSVKKDDSWIAQLDQADFAIVAGGDGTIRRVVKELVKRTVLDKQLPLAVLPMGTANNLSTTLGIRADDDRETIIDNWKLSSPKRFDLGVIRNAETTDFFMESAGYGLFPNLIQEMDSVDKSGIDTTKEELKLALKVLQRLVGSAEASNYSLKIDDKVITGKCLLIEVMNIQSIGPNLNLAADAKTDDGVFDIVYVTEEQREEFAAYIGKLINEENDPGFPYQRCTAKELTITCDSKHMHLDDELIVPLKKPLILEVRENVLEFLTKKE